MKIVVTGGFTPTRIRQFEDLVVPADVYGVGSWLLSSCDVCGTNNDFTADVVRVRIEGSWYDLAKTGRKACDNLMLERVRSVPSCGESMALSLAAPSWQASSSFVSPCVLPIVPGYLSFISGRERGGAQGGRGSGRASPGGWP